ncbi:MAG: SIS domain-containing protein [Actinomycetota bacterium]|nr:SIS domain-containing protein [Actinomycetota bacterium]
MIDGIRRRVELHEEMVRSLLADGVVEASAAVAELIVDAYRRDAKVVLFGNGGSAADAQHVAAEFTGRFLLDRRPLSALALTENVAALTAIGNDYDYSDVFARQLSGVGSAGDVAIGLSTSGSSANVLSAMRRARELGMATVAVTGARGDELAALADHCIRIPSAEAPQIQEGTMLVLHSICEAVERALFGG